MDAPSRLSLTAVQVRRPGWSGVFAGLLAISLGALLLAPWSIEAKSIAVLHGLCAQRPSHSFWFGPDRLPFDARMTGIYGAFLITQAYLLVRGRWRAGGVPSLWILSVFLIFVVVMGLDGLNSTLDDVRLLTVYPPSNLLRFVTGAFTGTTLAVFLWLLTSNILWAADRQRRDPVIGRAHELALMAVPVAAFGALAMSGWRPVYSILAVLLVLSAVVVIFELAMCFVQISRKRENSAVSIQDLAQAAVWSLLAAYIFMAAIAGTRFWMEAALGIKQLQ